MVPQSQVDDLVAARLVKLMGDYAMRPPGTGGRARIAEQDMRVRRKKASKYPDGHPSHQTIPRQLSIMAKTLGEASYSRFNVKAGYDYIGNQSIFAEMENHLVSSDYEIKIVRAAIWKWFDSTRRAFMEVALGKKAVNDQRRARCSRVHHVLPHSRAPMLARRRASTYTRIHTLTDTQFPFLFLTMTPGRTAMSYMARTESACER